MNVCLDPALTAESALMRFLTTPVHAQLGIPEKTVKLVGILSPFWNFFVKSASTLIPRKGNTQGKISQGFTWKRLEKYVLLASSHQNGHQYRFKSQNVTLAFLGLID